MNRTLKSIQRKSYLTENRTDKIFMLVFLIIFGLCFVPFVLKSRQNQKNDIPVSVSNKVYPENNNILYIQTLNNLTCPFKEKFMSPTGKPFSREDLMMLLHNLENITIKASYVVEPASVTLYEFGLEKAVKDVGLLLLLFIYLYQFN